MPLSQDLLSLQNWFDLGRTGGARAMSPEAADRFSRALGACFAQAVAMEETPLFAVTIAPLDTDEMMRTARLIANATNVALLHGGGRPLWAGEGGAT